MKQRGGFTLALAYFYCLIYRGESLVILAESVAYPSFVQLGLVNLSSPSFEFRVSLLLVENCQFLSHAIVVVFVHQGNTILVIVP